MSILLLIMNLLLHYQKKIFDSLKNLEKKKLIQISSQLKRFTVELPPKNHKADISCNAAMILAKVNKTSPIKLGEILKKHLLSNFKEFKSIEIAGPGFLNICFNISFWREYLTKIIKLDSKYGSNATLKKKYNIEFVSANPTGPLHVGHCRGAVLGDVLSNLLSFNGNKVTKEYYVNDYGEQIKSFVSSVYYRILEIIHDEENAYEVVEAYYDEDGAIDGYTDISESPLRHMGDTVDELIAVYEMILKDLKKSKDDVIKSNDERRKKAQHTWYDHNLELRVSGNRRENTHDYSQTSLK